MLSNDKVTISTRKKNLIHKYICYGAKKVNEIKNDLPI